MIELIQQNYLFLSGFILGGMLCFGLAYTYYTLKLNRERKKIEADAIFQGIETGVALEAEIGWKKQEKKPLRKKRKNSSKKSQR